jgi:hypothetical protein
LDDEVLRLVAHDRHGIIVDAEPDTQVLPHHSRGHRWPSSTNQSDKGQGKRLLCRLDLRGARDDNHLDGRPVSLGEASMKIAPQP